MMTSYIALDLETTGLESKTEKITEAAALKVIDGTMQDRFVTLVQSWKTYFGENYAAYGNYR